VLTVIDGASSFPYTENQLPSINQDPMPFLAGIAYTIQIKMMKAEMTDHGRDGAIAKHFELTNIAHRCFSRRAETTLRYLHHLRR